MPDFAVNVDYLADAVSALSSDEICLSIHDPLKPLLMTRPGDDSSKQIMMPVRV
jgi:DNA polymerase III sliding clamp (beta) subunit (PCNA family)